MGSEMVQAEVAGLALEVVDNEWVTLRSLFEPFGKEPRKQVERLKDWANLAKVPLASRRLDNDSVHLETWVIHRTHVPQAIAELDPRGMPDDVKASFVRFKRECAAALDAYFTRGAAVNPRHAADPWAAIQQMAAAVSQMAVGAQSLQEGVREAKSGANDAARVAAGAERTAAKALHVAEQARSMAGARGVLDAVAAQTPAGGSSSTPDGAWSAKPPPGYLSMRALARELALPSDGVGQGFVGRVARALGVQDDDASVSRQDVVIGGRARRQHITYGPKGRATLDAPLRAAHATMVAFGYTTKFGVMTSATLTAPKRSKVFVLEQMFEAAVAGSTKPPANSQGTIPGIDDQQRAG